MRGRALRRLSPIDLMGAVAALVEEGTGTRCVATVGEAESPYYIVEFVGSRPAKSRTMFLEDMTLYVHAIDAPSESQLGVLAMVQAMEEAMEATPSLPEPFHLVLQNQDGINQVKRDPSGEWHAVVSYTFRVSYGLRIK